MIEPYYQKQSQRVALTGLLVLLLPIFFSNLFTPLGRASPSMFSEWNAPKPKHLHLLKEALQRQTSDRQQSNLWSPLPNQRWKPCVDSTISSLPKKPRGYIQVFLDGGLNQQRMGICDAVAVAKILNATLIIPHLEVNPVWQDSSSFGEIFDVDHFINILKDEVSIVKELPSIYSWSTREYYGTGIRSTRIKTAPVHASENWYLENVLPILESSGIAAIAPFSHRLAFDNLPSDLQHLRCKVNFQALVFLPHIRALGDALINRLQYPLSDNRAAKPEYGQERKDDTDKNGAGKYVVLHLRFDKHEAWKLMCPVPIFRLELVDTRNKQLWVDKKSWKVHIEHVKHSLRSKIIVPIHFSQSLRKDMAAHSACDFGGGKAEKLALAKYRQVLWQGRVLNSQFTDDELRKQGRCPLTPEEIGLLLAALGFNNNTRLYLASHKVYGGEARISALRKLFPLMEDKKSLASEEERAEVEGKASLLAAVDYYVSMQSDIFISASPGNMHNALVGHRAYKNLKTIRPNMGLLGQVFLNKSMDWTEFQQAVVNGHKNRHGQIRLRKEKQSIYTYPLPDCMCRS